MAAKKIGEFCHVGTLELLHKMLRSRKVLSREHLDFVLYIGVQNCLISRKLSSRYKMAEGGFPLV